MGTSTKMTPEEKKREKDMKTYMTTRNKSIRIGTEYQAIIPDIVEVQPQSKSVDREKTADVKEMLDILTANYQGVNLDFLMECLQEVVANKETTSNALESEDNNLENGDDVFSAEDEDGDRPAKVPKLDESDSKNN
eukprot:GDKK01067974.1.p2 GENE.GDKK01067974.1~~GDKK01067974.1.p2  ORF type:complete len:136 (-),score=28.20 GDKK01067974.1:67-474(-)